MRMLASLVLAVMLLSPQNLITVDQGDAELIARAMYGECRGIESTMEQAAVAWTILNRVDDPRFPGTVKDVVTQPSQFTGYKPGNPIDPELLAIAQDVLSRWQRERDGEQEVGRVLPAEYVFFVGRNGRNYFGYEWPVAKTWDWSAEDVYKEAQDDGIFQDGGYRDPDGLGGYCSFGSDGPGSSDDYVRDVDGGSFDPQSRPCMEEVLR